MIKHFLTAALCFCLPVFLGATELPKKELPKFKLGGALRFNYNFSDWNEGHRDRGGDLGYDVFMLHPQASYKNFLLEADARFYSTAYGGFMLKYGWIGYRFSEKNHLEFGFLSASSLPEEIISFFKFLIMSDWRTIRIWE